MSNEEKYKLMLFLTIRNNGVIQTGEKLGKSQKEICQMARDVMKSMETMIDFDSVRRLWEETKE